MKEARINGNLVPASKDAPDNALCPACGSQVKKRQRRNGEGEVTYFYRHKIGLGDGCPYRYRPTD